jgi:capping protein alpha
MGSNQDGSLELKRAALQVAVTQYVSRQYSAEHAAGSVYAKDGQLFVCITGERPNLRNFWSGKWNSMWTIAVAGGSATITGEIKVHAHYFEDGNVQMQSSKPVVAAQIPSGASEKEFAEALVNHIKTAESTLQGALGDMYANMNEETFRAMRRILPVTRTKMEWNVNAVRMVSQLTGPGSAKK